MNYFKKLQEQTENAFDQLEAVMSLLGAKHPGYIVTNLQSRLERLEQLEANQKITVSLTGADNIGNAHKAIESRFKAETGRTQLPDVWYRQPNIWFSGKYKLSAAQRESFLVRIQNALIACIEAEELSRDEILSYYETCRNRVGPDELLSELLQEQNGLSGDAVLETEEERGEKRVPIVGLLSADTPLLAELSENPTAMAVTWKRSHLDSVDLEWAITPERKAHDILRACLRGVYAESLGLEEYDQRVEGAVDTFTTRYQSEVYVKLGDTVIKKWLLNTDVLNLSLNQVFEELRDCDYEFSGEPVTNT